MKGTSGWSFWDHCSGVRPQVLRREDIMRFIEKNMTGMRYQVTGWWGGWRDFTSSLRSASGWRKRCVWLCGGGGEFLVTFLWSGEMKANEFLVKGSSLPLLGLSMTLSLLFSYNLLLCKYHFKKGRWRSSFGNPSFVDYIYFLKATSIT